MKKHLFVFVLSFALTIGCSAFFSFYIGVLKQLGCQYILSAVNIDNYKELNLKYQGSFTTENSFWDIKVYKL